MNITEKILESERGSYYLESIDYSSQEPSYWSPIRHLEFTMAYIRSIGKSEIDNNEDVKKRIIGLIDYWLENDFHNDKNWYYNQIAVPYDLADIAVMMFDYLGTERLRKISFILDRGTIDRGADYFVGSNRSDYLNISIYNAVISQDSELLGRCMDEINSLIEVYSDRTSGIQEDYTYFENTSFCSGGSYSATYSRNIAWFVYLMNGTTFSVNEDKEKLLIDFILDGQYFFHMNDGIPQWCIPRTNYQASGGNYMKETISLLNKSGVTYRKSELEGYEHSFDNANMLNENIKYFPAAGTLVYKSQAGYIGVRGAAEGVSLTSVQNKEGVLNYNYSYGSNTCYMLKGDEYSSLGAVYDWSMLPGTTTYYENDDELFTRWENDYNKTWGHIEHFNPLPENCDGKADSQKCAGVMVTELHNGDIDGKNAFIIYQGCLYCLGNSFNSKGDDGHDILTIVDQCLAEDSEEKDYEIMYGESVVNGGFQYTNYSQMPMHIQQKNQKGTISRTSLNYPDADSPQEKNVFSCYYDWGNKLEELSYAYSIHSTLGTRYPKPLKIVNTNDLQLIVFDDGMIVGYAYVDSLFEGKEFTAGTIMMKLDD